MMGKLLIWFPVCLLEWLYRCPVCISDNPRRTYEVAFLDGGSSV